MVRAGPEVLFPVNEINDKNEKVWTYGRREGGRESESESRDWGTVQLAVPGGNLGSF